MRRGSSNLIAKFVQYKDNGTVLHFHRSVSLFTTKRPPHKQAYDPPVTIYMGRDKVKSSYYSSTFGYSSLAYWRVPDEDLIKYAWPQDIWFHVDKLSSAHVYLRLPESISSWEDIPEPLLIDCAQLVKANSIEGDSKIVSRFPSSSEPKCFREQTQ